MSDENLRGLWETTPVREPVGLEKTFAGREILHLLEEKYGTRDEKVLLEQVVLEHFDAIFLKDKNFAMWCLKKGYLQETGI